MLVQICLATTILNCLIGFCLSHSQLKQLSL